MSIEEADSQREAREKTGWDSRKRELHVIPQQSIVREKKPKQTRGPGSIPRLDQRKRF